MFLVAGEDTMSQESRTTLEQLLTILWYQFRQTHNAELAHRIAALESILA